MSNGIAAVEVKRVRGKLTVIALGRTPRGRRYIKESIPTQIEHPTLPQLKQEISAAVDKLFTEGPTPSP